jgi:hypothetical protein
MPTIAVRSLLLFSVLLALLGCSSAFATELPSPQFAHQWGTTGGAPGQFRGITSLAIAGDSLLLVGDGGNQRVQEFTIGGQYRDSIPFNTSVHGYTLGPDGLATGRDGSLYIMDGGGFVQKWTLWDSTSHHPSLVDEWTTTDLGGALPGLALESIATSPNYVYIVTDVLSSPAQPFGNGGLLKCDSTGAVLLQIPVTRDSTERLEGPMAIAADAQDNVFIQVNYTMSPSTVVHQLIRKFAKDGTFLKEWSLPNLDGSSVDLDYQSLSVDWAGALYYTRTNASPSTIDVLARDSLETTFRHDGSGSGHTFSTASAVLATDLCRLYVADSRDRVVELDNDADNDGLCDSWERDSMLVAGGTTRYGLHDCDIDHRDIYVEVDHMLNRDFDATAVAKVVARFASRNVALHVDVDTSEASISTQGWADPIGSDYSAFRDAHFGTSAEHHTGILAAKRLAYHYCVFADSVANHRTGDGEMYGNDMVVTLGVMRDTLFAHHTAADSMLYWDNAAGTFMHELGHNLGLDDGGVDTVIHKPNYFSVMNYTWQTPMAETRSYWEDHFPDYSGTQLDSLHESHLDDKVPIGGPAGLIVPIGPAMNVGGRWKHRWVSASGNFVDWNNNWRKDFCDTCDVNRFEAGAVLGPATPNDVLKGWNDWGHLDFAFRGAQGWDRNGRALGANPPSTRELTAEAMASANASIADCNANGVSDHIDIATGASRDIDQDGIPDECEPTRLTGLRARYVACPGGDADSISWGVYIDGIAGIDAGVGLPAYAVMRNTSSTLHPWDGRNRPLVNGDTLWAASYDPDSEVVRFRCDRWSGCGTFRADMYVQDTLVVTQFAAVVASVDMDSAGTGSVDRLDIAKWHSLHVGGCDTCAVCADFDTSGTLTSTDSTFAVSHLGHHIPRQFIWPSGTIAYSLGDTVRIGWRAGFGDSARVTIRAIRGGSADTTLIVADTLDTGSHTWTVPSTMRAAGDYKIDVVHTVGRFAADYRSLGLASSDTTTGIRPIPVADATTTRGKHSWTLSWDEPTQNAGVEADQYDVRYSAVPRITEANFSSMTVEPPDGVPGPGATAHCVESDSLMLTPHKYYFSIKTRVGSVWSRMSPLDSASTGGPNQEVFCSIGDLMAGGGGGGDESRRSGPTASERSVAGVASVNSELPVAAENSLLGWAGGTYASDTYKLPVEAALGDAGYAVRLRQLGKRPAEVDNVGLGYVDHVAGVESYVAGPAVLLGQSSSASAAWELGPGQTDQFVSATADSPLVGVRGSALIVQLNGSGPARALVIAATGPSTQAVEDTAGILVEVPAANATWQAVGLVHPRRGIDEFAVALPSGSQARLVYYGNYAICGLKQLAVQSQVVPTALTLAEATHSRLGDVKSAESAEGGGTTTLDLGDTLNLSFPTAASSGEMTRELFLTTRGRFGVASLPDTLQPASAAIVVAPVWQFSLGNARPNPSIRDFTIDYTLARDTPVGIRVYDVAGRLVRTLVNGTLPAGPHSIIWDGRNQDGRRVASSVYFYRMVAGSFTSQRKAVLLTH